MSIIATAKVPGNDLDLRTTDTAAWPMIAWEGEQRGYAAGRTDGKRAHAQQYRCDNDCVLRFGRGEITEADYCPACVATHAAWDRAFAEATGPYDLGYRLADTMAEPLEPGGDREETICRLGAILWPYAQRRQGLR
jgi:hypothetical protein